MLQTTDKPWEVCRLLIVVASTSKPLRWLNKYPWAHFFICPERLLKELCPGIFSRSKVKGWIYATLKEYIEYCENAAVSLKLEWVFYFVLSCWHFCPGISNPSPQTYPEPSPLHSILLFAQSRLYYKVQRSSWSTKIHSTGISIKPGWLYEGRR